MFALLTVVIATFQTTASAAAIPSAAGGVKSVKILEGPLGADHASVLHGLMSGRTPASLGLHAPSSKDISRLTQKDLDALTQQHPAAVGSTSEGTTKAGMRPGEVTKPPNTLSRTDCEAAVQSSPSGADYYILSRFAICEADAEYVEFFVNGQLEGSLVYQRTIVGTAPGQTATSTPRDLKWSLYIDTVMPDGVTDPNWTIIPSVALNTVTTGTGTIQESYQLPPAWTLTEMEAAGVEEWDSSDSAPVGGGAQPDDVYSGLVTFTITSQPGPGWTCLPTCVPNTSQPLAMRWDNASYIGTSTGGAAVFPISSPCSTARPAKRPPRPITSSWRAPIPEPPSR